MADSLDRRSEVESSGWHWGDGVQYEKIHSVPQLAAELRGGAGIAGLETVDPSTSGFAARAAELFHRDGFVCCRGALEPGHLEALRLRCDRAMHEIVGADTFGGAKGAHRYMFGGSSLTGSCMHFPEWAQLAALPAVDAILQEIWGSADFTCHGGGGDFCLPGCEYQPLHSDSSIASKSEYDQEGNMMDILLLDAEEKPGHTYKKDAGFWDPSGRLTLRDIPPPQIIVDFNTTAWGPLDGAIRFVPGTQNSRESIPSLRDEPRWMRMSTVSPIPAGCAIIRDIRTWHGGTPVLSATPRAMPSCNYFAPYFGSSDEIRTSMPRAVFSSLCPRGQQLCRHLPPASAEEEAGLSFKWKEGGSRVTRHRMTLEKLQRARATIGGSMTGFWPPPGAEEQQGQPGGRPRL